MAIGGASFAIGRLLIASDSPAEAQLAATDPCAPEPESDPTPIGAPPSTPRATPAEKATPPQCLPPTIQALNDQLVAEAAKPKFVGVLNGFTFYAPGLDVAQIQRTMSAKCTGSNGRAGSEAEGKSSPLYFAPGYIPPTSHQPPEVYVGACQDEVVTIGFEYQLDNGLLTIYHIAGAPLYEGRFPSDRLQPSTIGGRPAVVAAPLSAPSLPQYTIFMRDARSFWIIQGRGVPQTELIKVGEGVR